MGETKDKDESLRISKKKQKKNSRLEDIYLDTKERLKRYQKSQLRNADTLDEIAVSYEMQ